MSILLNAKLILDEKMILMNVGVDGVKDDDDSDNGGYVVGLAQHWEEADHIKEMCYNAMLGFSIQ